MQQRKIRTKAIKATIQNYTYMQSLGKTIFLRFLDKFAKHAPTVRIKDRKIEFKNALTPHLPTVGSIKRLVRNALHFI